MIDHKKLQGLSKTYRQKNGYFAVIIFIFAGILIAAISLLDLLLSNLIFIILFVPLLILPIAFSLSFLLNYQDEGIGLSFGAFCAGIKAYFSERFSSTFSFFRTLLISLCLYLGLSIISLLVINLSLYQTNFLNYRDIVDEFFQMYNEAITVEMLDEFIKKHSDSLNQILLLTNALPLTGVCFFATYRFSINSISLFARLDFHRYNGKYISHLHKNFVKSHWKEFYAADFYLNWPYYLGFIIFFGLGGYLGSLYEVSEVCTFVFGLAFALFFYIAIVGSLRAANKEAIYNYFKEEYHNYDFSLQANLLNEFAVSLQKQLDIHADEEKEDTKKDSDES